MASPSRERPASNRASGSRSDAPALRLRPRCSATNPRSTQSASAPQPTSPRAVCPLGVGLPRLPIRRSSQILFEQMLAVFAEPLEMPSSLVETEAPYRMTADHRRRHLARIDVGERAARAPLLHRQLLSLPNQ